MMETDTIKDTRLANSGWHVVEDMYGAKHIAPFHIIRRKRRHNHITKGEKPYLNGKCSKSQTKKDYGG